MCLSPGFLPAHVIPGRLHVVRLGGRWRPPAKMWDMLVLPLGAGILETVHGPSLQDGHPQLHLPGFPVGAQFPLAVVAQAQVDVAPTLPSP